MPLSSKPGASRDGMKSFDDPRPAPVRRCAGVMDRASIETSYRAGQITESDYKTLIEFCDQLAEMGSP